MPFRIIVDPERQRRRHVLPIGETVVGSAPDCDITVSQPTISRRHAAFSVGADTLTVRDLESSNGTWIGSRRIDEMTTLSAGDVISLGSTEVRVETVSAGDLEVATKVGGPTFPRVDIAETGGGLRTTLPSSLLQRFTLDVLPSVLERIQSGQSVSEVAAALGAAVAGIFPCPHFEIRRRRGDFVAVLFTHSVPLPTGARVARIERSEGDLLVEASFFPPETLVAYEPVNDIVLRLLTLTSRVGSGRQPESQPTTTPPPPMPDPTSVEPEMQKIYEHAGRIAKARISVLIQGESGTGKEVLARYLHSAAEVEKTPFIALNCAALPRDLLEVELFGIEERVATGVDARAGKFEQANGGTLFLDEIGDMPLETQAKILRVLQEQEIYRIGGDRSRRIDAQVLAATNKDLEAMVREGTFRSDLFHRLAGWVIRLPALRERRGDIPQLAAHFLAKHGRRLGKPVAGLSRSAVDALVAYHWPGNVRELASEIHRAILFLDHGEVVESSHLRDEIGGLATEGPQTLRAVMERVERSEIEIALASTPSATAAAERLGIGRSTLYRRMAALGLADPRGES